MVTYHDSGEDEGRAVHAGVSKAAAQHRCACGVAHACDQALAAIRIPEEDSRLHARAYADFGKVPVGAACSAALAGNFNIRIHVPRGLQQQLCGNDFAGSVLGNARISADISGRVGLAVRACGGTEVCLFVGFHEERRGIWMTDLRVLRGSRLHVPVHIDAAIAAKPDLVLTTGIVPVMLQFAADVSVRRGPIGIPSGSLRDLWRSVRDQVRGVLAQHIEIAAHGELLRLRRGLRASLCSEPNQSALERAPQRALAGPVLA